MLKDYLCVLASSVNKVRKERNQDRPSPFQCDIKLVAFAAALVWCISHLVFLEIRSSRSSKIGFQFATNICAGSLIPVKQISYKNEYTLFSLAGEDLTCLHIFSSSPYLGGHHLLAVVCNTTSKFRQNYKLMSIASSRFLFRHFIRSLL